MQRIVGQIPLLVAPSKLKYPTSDEALTGLAAMLCFLTAGDDSLVLYEYSPVAWYGNCICDG